jgi:hypothetical protein
VQQWFDLSDPAAEDVTDAAQADVTQLPDLAHDEEREPYGDRAYWSEDSIPRVDEERRQGLRHVRAGEPVVGAPHHHRIGHRSVTCAEPPQHLPAAHLLPLLLQQSVRFSQMGSPPHLFFGSALQAVKVMHDAA